MFSNRIKTQIDDIFIDFDNDDTPGCILSIIKDGEIIYKNTYGMANLEHDIPIKENTVFNIGSVSKQFTAMCIGLLEEEGKLSLNDSIKKYIPELPEYCSKITVENLIYMTNGIRDFYNVAQYMMGVPEDNYINEEEALNILCGIKDPIFNTGEEWTYGNSGYFLLSIIVKRVTGTTLAEYADKNIFNPLGMENTFMREDITKITKNKAQGYSKYEYLHNKDNKSNKNETQFCINEDNCILLGAGQVWTTIGDLYLWDQNFYNNKLGKRNEKLIKKVTTSGKLNNGEKCGYGYGLFLGERNGRRYEMHTGGSVGFQSVLYRLPNEKLSIICFSNTNYGLMYLNSKLGLWIEDFISDLILEGKPVFNNHLTTENTEKTLSNFVEYDLEKYVGAYQCVETSSIWEITYEDKKLTSNENREQMLDLLPVDTDVFEVKNSNLRCLFKSYNENSFEIYVTSEDKEFTFIPFIQNQLTDEEIYEYIGQYYCDQIDTSFMIAIDNGKIYMKNKQIQRNGIDFHYNPTIKDNFVTYNDYAGSLAITFKRDQNEIINSFVFRDYDGDKRELLEFVKFK